MKFHHFKNHNKFHSTGNCKILLYLMFYSQKSQKNRHRSVRKWFTDEL